MCNKQFCKEIADSLDELAKSIINNTSEPLEFVWDTNHYLISAEIINSLSDEEYYRVRGVLNEISLEINIALAIDLIKSEEEIWGAQ